MRLIDADAMNEKLFYEEIGGKDTLITCEAAFEMIKAQPTSYSIEKVVEELEELRDMYDDCIKNFGIRRIIERAIEIVKQGGVSDDVCEYENTNDEYCKWKINSVFPETINNPHVAERENIATTKYCPYCGKKIKVVE